jgi:hypothetical protein
MELRELLSKKPVKFLTLLLTAMLIASASAAVYYSMNMQATATISPAAVIFVEGADASTNACNVSLGANSTYASMSIKAYPNATLTYTEPLNISNTGSSDQDVYLSHVSIVPNSHPDVGNFSFVNFTLYWPNGTKIAGSDFDYNNNGTDWNTPSALTPETLVAGTDWTVRIEIKAVGGATDGIDVTIVIAVNVQE